MKFVGYHAGHDATLSVIDEDGNLVLHAQAERYAPRCKNHLFNVDPVLRVFQNLKLDEEDIIVLTSINEEAVETPEYDPLLVRKFKFGPWESHGISFNPSFVIDHHLAHAISSWCFRDDDSERLFIAYDGAGATTDAKKPLKASLTGVISNDGFRAIYEASPIPTSIPICQILGGNSAGKAMGLAGYFPDVAPMECNPANVMRLLNSAINWSHCAMPCFPQFPNPDLEQMEFVASFYKFLIEQIWDKLEENINKFANGRGVVVGGGTALALELNTRIYNMTKDLVFGPPVNDSGLSLGAAAFAYFHTKGSWPKFTTPSLNSLQSPLLKHGPQNPSEIASLIANDKVIGLLRGKGEAGPRALGYRSLFASAQKIENLYRVSCEIKGREFYRPLAPIVTSESFDRYFEGPKGEYMQYRCICTEEAQRCLPVIVHRDLSARPQVVYKERDPWLHSLLVEYGKLSGHECFINTSLNKAGMPICNTLEDAKEDMKDTEVQLISIPEPRDPLAKSTPKLIA